MSGPPRNPTAKLRLAGSRLADDREKTEPKFEVGAPPAPRWLDAKSRKEWNRLVPMLEGVGVLTVADADALARYCKTLTRFRALLAIINKKGEIYQAKDSRGKDLGPRIRPEVVIANTLAAQLARLEVEFGITPASRSRVIAMPKKTKDKKGKARFFTGSA